MYRIQNLDTTNNYYNTTTSTLELKRDMPTVLVHALR